MAYSPFERPLTFFDIVGAVFRYKWRVMLVTLLMLCLSGIAIFLYPKKYESEAKLFVRLGRGSASLDTATVGQTISIQESRESEMNSIVDMLESRGLAERIVEHIGHERILKKFAWIEVTAEQAIDGTTAFAEENFPGLIGGTVSEGGLSEDELKSRKRFELAVKEVGSNLKIDSPKKSNTISVVFRARTPELARDIVQSVVDTYQQMHIEAYQSGGAYEFFDEQYQAQQDLVTRVENDMRTKKNEFAVVTMEGKQNSLQTEITEVKKLELETQAELQAAIAKVAELQSDLDQLPREMLSERTFGIAQNATDTMRDRLYALEIQEKELSSKFVATHPELQRVREQLRDARDIVEEQPQEREQNVVAVNPVRIDIENKLLLAEAEVASLQAKVDALDELEMGLIKRLNVVNDLEIETLDMQRQIEIARDNHRRYASKLEDSRINAALDREALSNVSVVAKPTVRYKHASPKRSILAVLAVLVSGLCGLSIALASDHAARSKELRELQEAERKRYLRDLEAADTEERPIRAGKIEAASGASDTSGSTHLDEPDDSELDSPKKAK